MRIVVYGAGAVGGVIGGRLVEHRAAHGHEVMLIARGGHYDAMRNRGLTITDPDRSVTLVVPVVDHPAKITWRADDIVILAMKTQHTEAALADLEAAAGPVASQLAIGCAQNGVENERLALRRFAKVYGICVMLPATLLVHGEVDVTCTPYSGLLDIGRYPSGNDATAEHIAAALRASTFLSDASEAVMAHKYSKLLTNTVNALDAALGPGGITTDLYKAARAEGEACYTKAGIVWTSEDAEKERRRLLPMRAIEGRPRQGGSTWQSLARGSDSVESDYLNGEISLLGRLHGVATPVNDALRRVAKRMARDAMAPGSLTEADVRAEIAPETG